MFIIKKETSKESNVELFLESRDNIIDVKAKFEGYTFTVLSFFQDGTVHKIGSIPSELGFKMDSEGRLIIE